MIRAIQSRAEREFNSNTFHIIDILSEIAVQLYTYKGAWRIVSIFIDFSTVEIPVSCHFYVLNSFDGSGYWDTPTQRINEFPLHLLF